MGCCHQYGEMDADVTLHVPEDPVAEAEVIGCAVATPHGYAVQVAHGVTVEHMYTPTHRRLWEACPTLPDTLDCDARVNAAAKVDGMSWWVAHNLVERRSTMWGVAPIYALRIAEAARLRTIMYEIGELYNAIGEGVDLEVAQDVIASLAR